MSGIGSLNERPLHASLKEWYARPGDLFEVKVDGYVIDLVQDDLLVEVQTKSFGSMRKKLNALVASHKVRLVHPIPLSKWIVRVDGSGEELSRRRSPRKGRIEDVFWELVAFPGLVREQGFSLDVLLIEEEELRVHDRSRKRRRRGWATEERRLISVKDRRLFRSSGDWLALLPEGIEERFTTGDLVDQLGIRTQLAQKMAYCLREAGLIELVGKKGRANLYEVPHGSIEGRSQR